MSEDRGTGAGNGGGQQQQTNEQPEWAKNLQTSSTELAETMKNLLAFAQSQAQQRQQQQTPQQQAPAEIEEEDVEAALDTMSEAQLEAMPRRQMLMTIMGEFNRNLAKQLKPIQDGVTQAQTIAIGGNIQQQTEKFAEKTPDFHEWGEEMKEIAGQHPGMHIRRIYGLARLEHPEKAAEMTKKYKIGEQPTVEEDKGKGKGGKPAAAAKPAKPAGAFGGMSPSGDGGQAKNQRMSIKDAAEAAWEDTVAKFGDVFST